MTDLFAQFDKDFDVVGLQEDIKAAAENKTDYEEVPDGDYEVHIQKLELKKSSSGNPMVSCWFKIVDGSRKGSIIFMNQVITQGFQIHIVNEFLRSLGTDLNIEFKSYTQYAGLLANVLDITKDFDYALCYEHNSKGFAEFKITDVFELA